MRIADTPVTIVVDTREHLPYAFGEGVTTERRKLDAGDYSVAGYERRFTIERKSLADLLGTITRGRERFNREMERLKPYDEKHLVIEASMLEVMDETYPRSDTVPRNVVLGSLVSIEKRYGILVHFCHDRRHAAWYTEWLCRRWAKRHLKGDGAE